jgi:hypothetical protein
VTVWTYVRPLASTARDVFLETADLREFLVTMLTLVLLLFRANLEETIDFVFSISFEVN